MNKFINIRLIFNKLMIFVLLLVLSMACSQESTKQNETSKEVKQAITAKDILGNPNYLAISFSGYRAKTRDIQPTIEQLKEDMRILAAMGIKTLRTYDTGSPHALNTLKAIAELKQENANFEMYVMLGAWIDCEGARTDSVNHNREDLEANIAEIERAVKMANDYPDIVKIIAVGNEAMVKWATSYFVQPSVILKWVDYLQDLKMTNKLPKNIWITSSDNFASWGGGGEEYHVEDLEKLIRAVDFVSLHTYPMHDTHYNPDFWGISGKESNLSDLEKIDIAMKRATDYAIMQYNNTKSYINSLGVDKPIHVGETGWASYSNGFYGKDGSKATDEYKEALYHNSIRKWTNDNGISCFYFEAFDEIWKDATNPSGSENHFGLFTVDGKAKYAVWDLVDQGVFEGLSRDGSPITKTFDGNKTKLIEAVSLPPLNELLE